MDKTKSEYVLWLIGYDITGKIIKEEEVWNFMKNIDVSEKILFLEASYHMLHKIEKGQKIGRFRQLIDLLHKEVVGGNNKVLLRVIKGCRKDWDSN